MNRLLELGYIATYAYEEYQIKIKISKNPLINDELLIMNNIFVVIGAYYHSVSYSCMEMISDNEMHELMKFIREEVEEWQKILKERLLIKGLKS